MKKRKKSLLKIRKKWRINPGTRVKESKKVYRRPKAKSNLRKRVGKNET